jgi:hypothetical protein
MTSIRATVAAILALQAGTALAQESDSPWSPTQLYRDWTQSSVYTGWSRYTSELSQKVGDAIGQYDMPPGVTLEPRLDWAVQYADNVELASDGGTSAFGAELAPGIYASYDSSKFTGALDYSLIGRIWDDSDLNDVTHQLDANGRWTAVPELLFVDAQAGYGDTLIDSSEGGNFGGLGVFNQGNIAEQATASISPTLYKRFKDFDFRASYSYGRVWYLDTDQGGQTNPGFGFISGTEDSTDQSADVRIGYVPSGSNFYGSLFYTWQRSEFEFSIPYQYEQAGIDAGYQLTRTVSIVGRAGKESDLDASTTQGGLDSNFWDAGLSYSPNDRTTAEARYGERFFGNSYSASVYHRARLLEFDASYSESPQVETRQLSLGQFNPGTLPGRDPTLDFGRFNSTPYVSRDTRAGVAAVGSRTRVGLSAWNSEREYVREGFGDEYTTGVAVDGRRELASNLSVTGYASYVDLEREASTLNSGGTLLDATRDYTTQISASVIRTLGPRVSTSLEAGYFTSSGTTEYDGWWIGLRGRWIPDLGR